ncbi:5'-nucleotidase C-terminal domain-containing protein [Petrotoga sp. 9PWA.NaAc.5.4]|uniref:5'-nucleotidase C-terminal domain-containing protein n=1 Tax=Petrotoga sp. 9PWA.NaAc.5.4 TaxID=1434328 RepID=UPI000CC3DE7A|nr:5'-nucleotidase C-terminal domain-containing protein [Petrotoga sp. 9PWA.NaAc.5.4]PNR92515.1 5'-nucleotidase [Petrotoga sp. 9PWA.NaAc.5.4]
MKSKVKKSILFLIVFCLSIFSIAFAVDDYIELQILATSDLHGRFLPYDYALNQVNDSGSLAQVATIVKELRSKYPNNTILIDNGDTIQENLSNIFIEDALHPMVFAMNEMEYDVWVLGNHEFNYGVPTLKKIMRQFIPGDWSYDAVLSGNVYNPDGTRLAAPYKIVTTNDGIKVGIIGMVTPNITRWDAANLKDYIVVDPVDEVRVAVAQLKGKVDVIVGAFHLGYDQEYGTYGSGAIDILKASPDLDVVILGHAHQKISETYYYNGKLYQSINGKIFDEEENDITQEVKLNGTLIVEPGNWGRTLSQVVLTLKKEGDKYTIIDKSSNNFDVKTSSGTVLSDKELERKLQPFHYKALDYANEVIGELKGGDLVPKDEIKGIPQVWIQPTAMIDLINSVQMYYGEQVIGKKIDVSGAAPFREDANIKEGPIKRSDISLIYRYDNTLYVLEVTGAQLKRYMEWSVAFYNQFSSGDLTISFNQKIPGYNYDIFKGVSYEIDISKPAGERIVNLRKNDGTPIKDDDVLTLAVNNYRANTQLLNYGPIFKEGEKLPKLLGRTEDMPEFSAISGGDMRKLIEKYIIEVKKGVLTPDFENNWKIIGNEWDEDLHELVKNLANEGKININKYKPVRVEDIQSFVEISM